MQSPALSIAQYLAAQGFGVFAAESGWSIHVASEPEKPDTCITVYDTGGEEPDTDQLDRRPTFQVRVRGPNYQDAYAKISSILDFLMHAPAVTLNGTRYAAFAPTSDVASIGKDDNNRHVLTVNFRVPNAEGAST